MSRQTLLGYGQCLLLLQNSRPRCHYLFISSHWLFVVEVVGAQFFEPEMGPSLRFTAWTKSEPRIFVFEPLRISQNTSADQE